MARGLLTAACGDVGSGLLGCAADDATNAVDRLPLSIALHAEHVPVCTTHQPPTHPTSNGISTTAPYQHISGYSSPT